MLLRRRANITHGDALINLLRLRICPLQRVHYSKITLTPIEDQQPSHSSTIDKVADIREGEGYEL
jgi:hypothetical protein